MIDKLRLTDRAEILHDMEALCGAYISLANWNVDQYKKETSKFEHHHIGNSVSARAV